MLHICSSLLHCLTILYDIAVDCCVNSGYINNVDNCQADLAKPVNTLWYGSARRFTAHHILIQVDLGSDDTAFILRRDMLGYSLKCK